MPRRAKPPTRNGVAPEPLRIRIDRKAYAELQAAGGDRKQAGWLEWDAVADELGAAQRC